MAENKVSLSKKDRQAVCFRHQFLQGSWNYERMQNGGWCYSMIPAIKKLYTNKDDQIAALKRHMEFYNTHPYVSAPVIGVTLALSGNILGPILFFVLWNVIRIAFLWYTQEFGYKVGSSIAKDLSGGLMGKVTEGASILGMFIIGALVERWVSISFTPVVSQVTQSTGAYIDWSALPAGAEGIKSALTQYASLGATGLDQIKVTTLQANLDSLIPGLAAVGLTMLCCYLLKKKVSPIVIILALFAVGIIGRVVGFM